MMRGVGIQRQRERPAHECLGRAVGEGQQEKQARNHVFYGEHFHPGGEGEERGDDEIQAAVVRGEFRVQGDD
jgi:hypothetical protein